MESNTSLNNYSTYGDTTKTISKGRLILTTTISQYWILIRWGTGYKPISEVQGNNIKLKCDFECEQTVTFESNVNNISQDSSTDGEVTMNVPSDATGCYFSIKSQNTVIYVNNVQVYII